MNIIIFMKKLFNNEIQLELSLRSVENWKLLSGKLKKKQDITSMGRHLSRRYRQVILVSGYSVLTAVN